MLDFSGRQFARAGHDFLSFAGRADMRLVNVHLLERAASRVIRHGARFGWATHRCHRRCGVHDGPDASELLAAF